jgi:hypothetical protein
MEYYVYVLLDPRETGSFCFGDLSFESLPYYVGKGKGKRADKHFFPYHLQKDANKMKTNKIKKIVDSGFNPRNFVKIISKNLSNCEASSLEINLIKIIGRSWLNEGPLTNLTAGGDGLSKPNKNKGKTLEEIYGGEKAKILKEKLSKSRIGENNPNFGNHKSTGKSVKQLDLDNNLIKIWSSIKEASDELDIPYGAISKCLSPKDLSKQTHKFKWEYVHKINPKNITPDKRFFQYEVTFPNGDIKIITNLSQLARENNLSSAFFPSLASGRRTSKFWKCKKI